MVSAQRQNTSEVLRSFDELQPEGTQEPEAVLEEFGERGKPGVEFMSHGKADSSFARPRTGRSQPSQKLPIAHRNQCISGAHEVFADHSRSAETIAKSYRHAASQSLCKSLISRRLFKNVIDIVMGLQCEPRQ
jgi:hypothetical protein